MGDDETLTVHNINCASLRRDGDQECSCKPEPDRRPIFKPEEQAESKGMAALLAHHGHGSIDDASGEEWNAAAMLASAAAASVPITVGEDRPEAPVAPPVDSEDIGATLTQWWVSKAQEEAQRTVPKAVEYGGANRSADLAEIGRTMWSLMDQGGQGIEATEGMFQELGIYFYVIGKLGRWTAAIREGRSVSDDTLFDIGVYIKMVQRIREEGGWPV